MTAFVFDFKDINSRMKGDLLERKEPSRLCQKCKGTGRVQVSTYGLTAIFEECPDCVPFAIQRLCLACSGFGSNPFTGKKCLHCNGSGMAP
jgi:DnaJ-class molecular chaperone